MMTVYVVECGEYSDRHVVCVCDTKEKAESVESLGFGSVTVRPFEVNSEADRLLQGYRRWRIDIWVDTLDVIEAEEDWAPESLGQTDVWETSFWCDDTRTSRRRAVRVCLDALDRDHAIKIALDQARAFKASWIPVSTS